MDAYNREKGLRRLRKAFKSLNPMHYVYAISSIARKYIYVGMTDNPERRIHQHNSGYERTTKPYRPFSTLLIEPLPDRKRARAREKFLKTTVGRRYLRRLRDE